MSETFRETSFGEFIQIQRGHDLSKSKRENGNIPVMGSTGQVGTHNKNIGLLPGVTIGRSGSIGAVNFLSMPYFPLNTVLYVTDFKGNDPRFVYYFLKNFDFNSFNSGTVQPSLNRNYLNPAPISVPGLSTQKSIAHILGTIDDKIEVNQKMNRTLEKIARAIFKSWFVNFDPVRAKTEGRPTGLPSDISNLFPDELVDSELGQIPEGWEVRSLSTFVNEVDVKIKPSEQTESIPYVPIDCIYSKSLTLYEAKDGSEAKSSLVSFRKKDILFGAMRPYFHKVCIAPFNGTTRTTCLVLNAVHPEMYGFSLFTLSDEKTVEFATQNSTGSTIPYIKWKNGLEIMLVAIPNVAVAKKFNDLVGPIVEKFCLAIKTEKILTSLRDTLLPKLISGEIRVPDAEKFLEETVS